MTIKTIAQTIRDTFERELEAAPERRSRKTERCLPMMRLIGDPSRRDWNDGDRDHVSGSLSNPSCEYCQRIIAIGWRVEHPSSLLGDLLGYLLAPSHAPFGKALAYHLDHDECPTCRAGLGSPGLRQAAESLRAHFSKLVGDWPEFLDTIAVLPAFQAKPAQNFDEGASPAFQIREVRAVSGDKRITLKVEQTREGEWRAVVRSRDRSLLSRPIHVELTGPADSVGEDLMFSDDGQDGLVVIHNFGRTEIVAGRLGSDDFVAWAAPGPAASTGSRD